MFSTLCVRKEVGFVSKHLPDLDSKKISPGKFAKVAACQPLHALLPQAQTYTVQVYNDHLRIPLPGRDLSAGLPTLTTMERGTMGTATGGRRDVVESS